MNVTLLFLIPAVLFPAGGQDDPTIDEELKSVRELEQGYRAHHLEDYAEAERVFQKFLRDHPYSPEGRTALGRTLMKEGKREGAREHFEIAIRGAESSKELLEMARELSQGGEFDLASSALRKAAELDGTSESYAALGRYLTAARDAKGALEAFRKARTLSPERASTFSPQLQEAQALEAAEEGDFDTIRSLLSEVDDPGVRSFIQSLNRRMEPAFHDTRITLGTSPLYDSNAVAISDEPLAIGDISREDSFGWSADVKIDQRLFKFAGRELDASLEGIEKTYFDDDVPDATDVVFGLFFNPYTEPVPPLVPDQWAWYAGYELDVTFIDYETFLISNEIFATAARLWSPKHQTWARYAAAIEDFRDDPDRDYDDRDGVTHMLEIGHYITFREAGDLKLRGSVYGRLEAREGSNYEADMFGFRAGAGGPLVWEISWDVGLHYRKELYRENHTELNLEDERDDDLFEASAGLRRPVTENVTVWLKYSYTDRGSNVSEFDYSRNFIGFGVDWEF